MKTQKKELRSHIICYLKGHLGVQPLQCRDQLRQEKHLRDAEGLCREAYYVTQKLKYFAKFRIFLIYLYLIWCLTVMEIYATYYKYFMLLSRFDKHIRFIDNISSF